MITVTPNAIAELRSIKERKNTPDANGLRVLVQKGGCAGMQYGMKFDAPADGDEILDDDGVRVMVDPQSLVFLEGCVLDYSDALTDTGFKIHNPAAARSCGCGSSFEPGTSAQGQPAREADPDVEVQCKGSEEEN